MNHKFIFIVIIIIVLTVIGAVFYTKRQTQEPSNNINVSDDLLASLPPDPGEAGKATLAGVDADGDGMRDDIERYIALTYPDSAKTRAALTQIALAIQAALLDANDKGASVDHAIERLNAIRCLRYVRGSSEANSIFNTFRAQLLNTKERSIAYISADDQLGGQVFPGRPPADQLKSTCTFDPDVMKN